MSTEFEKAIVYEAFDEIYTDSVALQAHTSSQVSLTLIKGRMSEHMILKISLETTSSSAALGEIGTSVAVGEDTRVVFT